MSTKPFKLTLTQLDIASYHAQYREYLAQDIHSQLAEVESVITGTNGNHTKKIKVLEVV